MSRVALVTGAARGIGAATVRALADEGWAVVALDRCADDPRFAYPMGTRAELDEVVLADPSRLVAVTSDACDREAMARAVQLAEERFGGLDAVFAVAGAIAGGVPLWEMAGELQDAVIEINLKGVVVAAETGIPALLRRPEPRSGRFIAVASVAATRGLPHLAAYCAAKAGVTGLVRALATELSGTGVTANTVNPGSTATRMLDQSARLYGLDSAEAFSAQQPLGRLIAPEEVAATLVWLAGTATSAVTGASIPIDGGLGL